MRGPAKQRTEERLAVELSTARRAITFLAVVVTGQTSVIVREKQDSSRHDKGQTLTGVHMMNRPRGQAGIDGDAE